MDIQPHALYSNLLQDLKPFLSEDPYGSEKAFACHSLASSLLKKFTDDEDERVTYQRAYAKFLRLNEEVASYTVAPNTSLDEVLLNETKLAFRKFFDDAMDRNTCWWTLSECFARGRPGPGASLKANGNDFYTKLFSSPMSTTSRGLYDHFTDALTSDPLWAVAELQRDQLYGTTVVRGNRLSFVPKTREIARTICTEPNLNMFYQLGLAGHIEDGLKRSFGISLATQPDKNRAFARAGSYPDHFMASCPHGYATIDLESASDTFSLTLLDFLLSKQSAIYGLLHLLRSREATFQDVSVPLHMVSTMGNGFTFPLQTLLFTCAVVAVFRSFDVKPNFRDTISRGGNCGVFGDDIIVPNFMFERMCHLLKLLGFRPNDAKSFSRGPFRESCGHDYFNGLNVRGVYIKTLKTQASRISAINRLNRWSMRQAIPLPKTIAYLLAHTPGANFVPMWESDDAGVHLPSTLVPNLRRGLNGSFVYRRLENIPSGMYIKDSRVCVPRKGKKRAFNYEGLLISFLQGSLRGNRIVIRQDRPVYRYRLTLTPNWDWCDMERWDRSPPNLASLASLLLVNMIDVMYN